MSIFSSISTQKWTFQCVLCENNCIKLRQNCDMNTRTSIALVLAAFAACTGKAQTFSDRCWVEASQMYSVPASLLMAIAHTESSFNPVAKNRNSNGTEDIGIMQINSSWLPVLKQYGISEKTLLNACTNIKVGAWILANNAKKFGWNWNAIGAYNAGCKNLTKEECEHRRGKYAWKVHAALQQVRQFKDQDIFPPNMPNLSSTFYMASAHGKKTPTVLPVASPSSLNAYIVDGTQKAGTVKPASSQTPVTDKEQINKVPGAAPKPLTVAKADSDMISTYGKETTNTTNNLLGNNESITPAKIQVALAETTPSFPPSPFPNTPLPNRPASANSQDTQQTTPGIMVIKFEQQTQPVEKVTPESPTGASNAHYTTVGGFLNYADKPEPKH